MFTEYVFENRSYDVALRDVKSILFDIVMSEQEKVTAIISKVRTTGDEKLQEKLIALCNEQGECLRNLLEISNSFSENLQLLDSYSRELKKIENRNIANIITGMRNENSSARRKAKKANAEQQAAEQQAAEQQQVPQQQVPQRLAQQQMPPQQQIQQPPMQQHPTQPPMPPQGEAPKAPAEEPKVTIPDGLPQGKIKFKSTISPEQLAQQALYEDKKEEKKEEGQPAQAPQTPPAPPAPQPQPAQQAPPAAPAAPEGSPADKPAEEASSEGPSLEDLKKQINGESSGKIKFKSTISPEQLAQQALYEEKKEEPEGEKPAEAAPAPVVPEKPVEEPPVAAAPAPETPTEAVEPKQEVPEEKPEELKIEPTEAIVENKEEEKKEENPAAPKLVLPLIPEEPSNTVSQETPSVENNTPVLSVPKVEDNAGESLQLKKENTDETKAILTSAKQIESLRNSLPTQEAQLNGFLNTNNQTEGVTQNKDAQLETQLVQNGLLPADSNNIQAQIESKMQEANQLYTSGKVEEAQKIYDEISALSKSLQPGEAQQLVK